MSFDLRLPSAALLARYPEHLPYLFHRRPLEPYQAAGLDLVKVYGGLQGAATNLYFIQADAPAGPIKIGVATRPQQRLEQLQLACPSPLTLITSVPASVRIEHAVHRHLDVFRQGGEWFAPAGPVLEVVAEFFEIGLMIEDYAADGCDLELDDLTALITEQDVAA